MRIPMWITNKVLKRCERIIRSRKPDFQIGANDPDGVYMNRWWVIPRNKWFNIYLHVILRSDRDEALHDHPWLNVSWILRGGYNEIMPMHADLPAGKTKIVHRWPGQLIFRRATAAHSLQLGGFSSQAPVSLFFTGRLIREWGFHCPKGWRSFKDFTKAEAYGERGAGCGEL